MFDFDQLDVPRVDGDTRHGTTLPCNSVDDVAAKDIAAGKSCRMKIGDVAADELLGSLLRMHQNSQYLFYLSANEVSKDRQLQNTEVSNSLEKPQDGKMSGGYESAQNQQEPEQQAGEDKEPPNVGEVLALSPELLAAEIASQQSVGEALDSSQEEGTETQPGVGHGATFEEKEKQKEQIIQEMNAELEAEKQLQLQGLVSGSVEAREQARKQRWLEGADGGEDSADEALGVLSSLGRSMSTWASVAYIGLSISMSSDPMVAGRQIASLCRSKGGIYVKAAQTASSMDYAFPKEVLEEFQALQDSADAQQWSEIEHRVAKHTPGGISTIYDSFSEEPINAASMAQVHVATRKNGQKVAVKILRRSLAQTFDRDVSDYLGLLGMYEAATGTPVKWMMEWAMEELKKELDFRWEADLQEECERFVKSKHELQRVAVPALHAELCSKRLLVMEFIDGCKITKAPEHFPDWDYGRDVPAIHEALETWHAMQLFLTGCLVAVADHTVVAVQVRPSLSSSNIFLVKASFMETLILAMFWYAGAHTQFQAKAPFRWWSLIMGGTTAWMMRLANSMRRYGA
ncbi:unnamed protein product [Durusdinium trenchii]|uniref:ABC1 atypical kinase-like domain-containing protein n=1 Tax=Durusdinium trenchii TaxID=1381693 RepID=A0ABP0Q170_9DINO